VTRPLLAASAVLGALALPGCSSGPDVPTNPRTLWLASLATTETRVRLVESEPPPF
jgi:hypothetical protein